MGVPGGPPPPGGPWGLKKWEVSAECITTAVCLLDITALTANLWAVVKWQPRIESLPRSFLEMKMNMLSVEREESADEHQNIRPSPYTLFYIHRGSQRKWLTELELGFGHGPLPPGPLQKEATIRTFSFQQKPDYSWSTPQSHSWFKYFRYQHAGLQILFFLAAHVVSVERPPHPTSPSA